MSLADQFEQMLPVFLDRGLGGLGVALIQVDEGSIDVIMFASDMTPNQCFMTLYQMFTEKVAVDNSVEVILGLDFYVDKTKNQGNEFNDFIATFYRQGDGTWKYGVIDYQLKEGEKPTIRPVQWEHPYWRDLLQMIHARWCVQNWPLKITLKREDGTEIVVG